MPDTPEALNLPFEEAISFLQGKANVTTESWRDVWGAAHSRSFSVAGAASEVLVADFREEIEKALEEGTTLQEFRKSFDDIVLKHGWDHTGGRNWRSRIIFETNMRTAYAAGRYAQLTLPGTLEAFPFWQYQHSGAVHPRLDHLSWDGKVWRADNPIWSTIYPPNGFGCGCFVIPASAADLRRQGKTSQDPTPKLETLAGSDRGVDPSFEYNPGQAWLSGGRPGEAIASEALIEVFERRALAGELPINATLPIAEIDKTLSEGLEIENWTHARISVATVRDHFEKHQLGVRDYAEFARAALAADIYAAGNGRFTSIIRRGGVDYAVGFKRTRLGEFLAITVHRINARKKLRIEKLPLVKG